MKQYKGLTRPKPKPRPPEHGGRPRPVSASPPTHWDGVADWYDELVGDAGSEYHREVVLPGVVRLLKSVENDRVLDVGCGQGVLCRLLQAKRARVIGVDASAKLLEAAKVRDQAEADAEPDAKIKLRAEIEYHVGDARNLQAVKGLTAGSCDAATNILAIQNIDPMPPVFEGVSWVLRPGGRFVMVMMHPAFRSPKATMWGFEGHAVQYRRVNRYLLTRKEQIVSHPGKRDGVYTWTFHRPLEHYVRAMSKAGLLIDAIEEWPSHKVSEPGPRAKAENVARQEIPMFMAIRAVKAKA